MWSLNPPNQQHCIEQLLWACRGQNSELDTDVACQKFVCLAETELSVPMASQARGIVCRPWLQLEVAVDKGKEVDLETKLWD